MISNYCTFYNNTVSSGTCIHLTGYPGTISKFNVVLNNSPNSYYGVVYVNGFSTYILNEFIFDQNKDILLYVNSDPLRLENCYFLTGSSSQHGSVINSLISTKTNYYIYSTYYCSFYHQKLNPTISKAILTTIPFTFFIIIFSK